jgi:hypothetical protein
MKDARAFIRYLSARDWMRLAVKLPASGAKEFAWRRGIKLGKMAVSTDPRKWASLSSNCLLLHVYTGLIFLVVPDPGENSRR